ASPASSNPQSERAAASGAGRVSAEKTAIIVDAYQRSGQGPGGEPHVTGQLPAELADWPAWTPDEEQLGELELITSGAFAPLGGYLGTDDLAAVAERGELADGVPWPVPVTLTVPVAAVPAGASPLALQDPEGAPLGVVEITERVPACGGSSLRLAGPVTALRPPDHGPFRALRRMPADVRAE